MVLTPHAVVGAGLASAFGLGPGVALVAGFASHFLLDSLPHWDYELASANIDEKNPLNNDIPLTKEALWDWAKIGLDLSLGFGLIFLFFMLNGQGIGVWSLLAGALGGLLPDGLQVLFMKWRREPFKTFFRFHLLMHSPKRIRHAFWGPFWQGLILLLALVLGNWSFFIW